MRITHNIALLAALSLYGCSSDDDPIQQTTNSLNWQACESTAALQCADLSVPKDFADGEGEKIKLALIRKPATGTERVGALLFNPGGPGGSGIELIEVLHEIDSVPRAVQEKFDLVSFDPRGIGQSTPVACDEFGLDDINTYPVGIPAVQSMHTEISTFAAACAEKYGNYLQQLGSLNVVRDMEEIRKALGEDKLNFIGYSYGTRLAALYLQEFPQSSGRIVLDGSISPDSSVITLTREALPAMQKNLKAVLARCKQTDALCDVEQLHTRLAERVNQLATDQSEDAQLEFELLGEIALAAMQDPDFADLSAAPLIEYLTTNDIDVLINFITLLEQFSDDDDDQEETGLDSETAQIAVLCADDPYRPDSDYLVNLLTEFNTISDPLAEAQVAQAATCAGWPQALEPLPLISTGTAPQSLVIGGTSDAQTPLQWSQDMALAIGGVFIRSEHQGHTAVFSDESECLDKMVEEFLLEGITPAETECR